MYFLLTSNFYSVYYTRGYIKDDLYSSLISINYQDLNNTIQLNSSLYQIVSSILPYYYVEIDNITYFYNIPLNQTDQGIEDFFILNGTIYYVNIYWK